MMAEYPFVHPDDLALDDETVQLLGDDETLQLLAELDQPHVNEQSEVPLSKHDQRLEEIQGAIDRYCATSENTVVKELLLNAVPGIPEGKEGTRQLCDELGTGPLSDFGFRNDSFHPKTKCHATFLKMTSDSWQVFIKIGNHIVPIGKCRVIPRNAVVIRNVEIKEGGANIFVGLTVWNSMNHTEKGHAGGIQAKFDQNDFVQDMALIDSDASGFEDYKNGNNQNLKLIQVNSGDSYLTAPIVRWYRDPENCYQLEVMDVYDPNTDTTSSTELEQLALKQFETYENSKLSESKSDNGHIPLPKPKQFPLPQPSNKRKRKETESMWSDHPMHWNLGDGPTVFQSATISFDPLEILESLPSSSQFVPSPDDLQSDMYKICEPSSSQLVAFKPGRVLTAEQKKRKAETQRIRRQEKKQKKEKEAAEEAAKKKKEAAKEAAKKKKEEDAKIAKRVKNKARQQKHRDKKKAEKEPLFISCGRNLVLLSLGQAPLSRYVTLALFLRGCYITR